MEEQNAQQYQNLPPIWERSLDPAIHVRVYKNGDENYPGKLVTLNKKQQRTFDSWLGDLSTLMKLRSGSVWRVYTPTQGHRVDDFDCLEDGKMIVVAGQERFKPIRYAQIESSPKKSSPKNYDPPGHPNRKYPVSGKCRKVDTQATIIKCWPNGNDTAGPRTVLLAANRVGSLEEVTRQVSGVLCQDCCGPVEKLYMPNGIKVMSLDQITPNGHFVALRRKDRFKRVHYKENSLPNLRCSPRLERKLPSLSHSNKTSSHSSPEHSITSQNGYRRDRERIRREEEGVFRPAKHKSKGSSERSRQRDYDQDNGGVFKARSQNNATRGARQIDDSRQTRTELPVDQRPAETVEDEEYEQGSPHDDGTDDSNHDHDHQEDTHSRNKRDRRGRKDESHTPPQADPQRAYRANARRPDSPGNERARKEKENEAQARRKAEDQARAKKQQQQQEAIRQRKEEKEAQRKREEEKRKEEEKERLQRRKEQEEEVKRNEAKKREERETKREEAKRKKEEEERRKREEEEEERRKREEEEEEKRKAEADARTSTPKRNERTPTPDKQPSPSQKEKEEENLAAAKIQAGFRGYRTRRDLKQQRSDEDDEQSGGRDSSLMRDEPISIQGEEEQVQAAIKIQAGFRGAKARKEVQGMRDANQAQGKTSPRPPSEDPSHTRTVSPNPDTDRNDNENQFTETDAEHAAATKIQAAFRGQQTRKELAAEKDKAKGVGNEDGAEH